MQTILVLTLTGLIVAVLLVVANKLLNTIKKNEEEILNHLPGFNCGACGFGSCLGMVEAMLKDLDNYKKCRPLRGEELAEMEKFVSNCKKS